MTTTIYSFFDNPEDIILQAEQHASTRFEMDFIENIRERFTSFGERMFMSEKQANVLERIANGRKGY